MTQWKIRSMFSLRSKYSLGLVQYSLSLHARSRLSLPTTHIDYIIHDFHWLSTACVRSESDENWGKCKTTLHDDHAAADQTLDGDIRVCDLPQRLAAYIMQSYDRDWNWIIALSCELDPERYRPAGCSLLHLMTHWDHRLHTTTYMYIYIIIVSQTTDWAKRSNE